MKELNLNAEMDVVEFTTNDVITTSGESTTAGWVPREPEGAPDYAAFVDASALLNVENIEELELFAFVHPKDQAKVRKALKDELKYVEAFARTGYIGTVAGINLYAKKDATEGQIVGGTKQAVTLLTKKGTEVEQDRDPDIRKNMVWSRKYYLAALTDATKAFKITLGA